MKVKVFEKQNEDVYLKLEQHEHAVYLNVVDRNGYDIMFGTMLIIANDGRVTRASNFNPEAGFKMDGDKVKIY
ncbi:MAG: hypothetical protein ACOCUV_00695 [bacterium]